MEKKLQINQAAGILSIVCAAVFALWLLFIFIMWAVWLLVIAGLVVNIIALMQSQKEGISTTGQILGIVGCVVFAVFPILTAWPAAILMVLAAIFTLKQKNVAVNTDHTE